LESLPYAALTLLAQLDVLMRMGQMALESLMYDVDRLYEKFDVVNAIFDVEKATFDDATSFGHTALESLV